MGKVAWDGLAKQDIIVNVNVGEGLPMPVCARTQKACPRARTRLLASSHMRLHCVRCMQKSDDKTIFFMSGTIARCTTNSPKERTTGSALISLFASHIRKITST